MRKPILFLDVDGPLNPYAAKSTKRPHGYITERMKPDSWIAMHPGKPRAYVKPLRVWVNPAHGEKLLSLPYELVWATTWEDEANSLIGPVIGLPAPGPGGTFFKTAQLVRYADGRPFVWVDDDAKDVDEKWIALNHPGFGKIHHVSPRLGLLDDDFRCLRDVAVRICDDR